MSEAAVALPHEIPDAAVLSSRHGDVLLVTLNRPDKRKAIDVDMPREVVPSGNGGAGTGRSGCAVAPYAGGGDR